MMGPNGAGKSFLRRLLHGQIERTAGSLPRGGQPLSEAVRRRQPMVLQRPVLVRRSVEANLRFLRGLRGPVDPARAHALLEHVGLAAHACRHPAGGAPIDARAGPEERESALTRLGPGSAPAHPRQTPPAPPASWQRAEQPGGDSIHRSPRLADAAPSPPIPRRKPVQAVAAAVAQGRAAAGLPRCPLQRGIMTAEKGSGSLV